MNIIIISPNKTLYCLEQVQRNWVSHFFKNKKAHSEDSLQVEQYIADCVDKLIIEDSLIYAKVSLKENNRLNINFLPDTEYGQSYIDFCQKKIIQYNSYESINGYSVLDISTALNPNIFMYQSEEKLDSFFHFIKNGLLDYDNCEAHKEFLIDFYNHAKPFIDKGATIAKNKKLSLKYYSIAPFFFSKKFAWSIQESVENINPDLFLKIYLSLHKDHNFIFSDEFINKQIKQYKLNIANHEDIPSTQIEQVIHSYQEKDRINHSIKDFLQQKPIHKL